MNPHSNLALALLFTLLLSVESLWLFALSAHIARFMETVAPVFWVMSLCAIWVTCSRKLVVLRMLLVGVALAGVGAILGVIAITSV